mgnify:CR=1 FL=1
MKRTGSRIVMEALTRHGVEVIFGYPGGEVLPLYDEMLNWPGVRHILVRHEQCAAHMADGYARASNKLVSCNVHVAPGLGNAIGSMKRMIIPALSFSTRLGKITMFFCTSQI